MHNRTAVPKEERPPVPAFTPVVELEERGGFVPGEAHWTDAGAEKPAALVERGKAGGGEGPAGAGRRAKRQEARLSGRARMRGIVAAEEQICDPRLSHRQG